MTDNVTAGIKRFQSAVGEPVTGSIKPGDDTHKKLSRLVCGTLSATQGLTLGWSDELIGLAAAAAERSAGSGKSKETYTGVRDAVRSLLEECKNDYPNTAGGSELTGSVIAMALGGSLLKGGAATVKGAKNLLDGVKSSALMGGIYGAGKGEGDAEDQAKSSATGAVASVGGQFLGNAVAPHIDKIKLGRLLESMKADELIAFAEKYLPKAWANIITREIIDSTIKNGVKAGARGIARKTVDEGTKRARGKDEKR